MKILGILPISIGGRLTISSIIDGFRQLGHEIIIYDELTDNPLPDSTFDLIVGYDFSPIAFKEKYCLETACVAYFSDEIRNKTSGSNWQELITELNNNSNYIFYWDRELVKQETFKNLFYLPHFVNIDIYKNLKLPIEQEVMFAGRLDTDYRLEMIEFIAEHFKLSWYAIERHYKDALNRAKNKSLIKQIYKGFIDNEKEMSNAINKSRIVINMNSQGISSLNYRTIQAIACGKLLISDKRAELDLFNSKIPTYENKEDLKNKISFYLNNEQAYNKTTEYCTRICRENHNSIEGVKYILEKLNI